MSSTKFSRLSPDEVAELRANAANPEFREMSRFGAPCGKTPAENFRMTLALIRELEPFYRSLPQDRSVPVVKSFIL